MTIENNLFVLLSGLSSLHVFNTLSILLFTFLSEETETSHDFWLCLWVEPQIFCSAGLMFSANFTQQKKQGIQRALWQFHKQLFSRLLICDFLIQSFCVQLVCYLMCYYNILSYLLQVFIIKNTLSHRLRSFCVVLQHKI